VTLTEVKGKRVRDIQTPRRLQ